MTTPRSTAAGRNEKDLALIRALAAISLLALGANLARHHLFLWALSAFCLSAGLWLYPGPVARRNVDRVRRAHACFYAGIAFFVLQFVSMLLA
jgi:hypothetical protein